MIIKKIFLFCIVSIITVSTSISASDQRKTETNNKELHLIIRCKVGADNNSIKSLFNNKPNIAPLKNAMIENNASLVKALLNNGAKLERGMTHVLYAAFKNNFEMVKAFVEYGADVNKASLDGTTALQHAISNENYVMIGFLIVHGANVKK